MAATVFTVETLGLAASSSQYELLLLGFGQGSVAPPVAGFTGTPTSGFAPLTVAYTDTSTGSITSEQFDPGDGSGILTAVPATHVYVSVGVYSPSLTVTGPGGSDTLTRTNYITVTLAPPVADFTGTPTSGFDPLSVTFTYTGTGGTPASFSWEKNDSSGWIAFAGTPTVQDPVEVFTLGIWSVRVTATNTSGSDTKTRTNYIHVSPSPPPIPAGLVCGTALVLAAVVGDALCIARVSGTALLPEC